MITIWLILLGLCFGSFVNAMVWRMHQQAKSHIKIAAKDQKLSIVHGRSMCPDCNHILAWYDLLPIFSWLSLKGKCRYCRKTISWQYPAVEILTAALFVFSYIYWPLPLLNAYSWLIFGLWLVFVAAFMALAVYDLRWMILPNSIVFPLQGLAALYLVIKLIPDSGNRGALLLASIFSVLCSAGLFYVLFQISDGKWIGGGDVKLAVILGILLAEPQRALLMLFIASLLGSLVGIPLLLQSKAKRNTRLPFGPFLIAATIIVYIFGAGLIEWYRSQLIFV